MITSLLYCDIAKRLMKAVAVDILTAVKIKSQTISQIYLKPKYQCIF